ncbi:S-adenosyl-L-methionine-dependent methyltransferase [Xylaria palmicola]|nr:S-adenosyl-L-methionine-dependent methyltransferase [Xylaria palmicola]
MSQGRRLLCIRDSVTPTNIDAVPKLLSEVASAGHAFSNTRDDDSVVARQELLAKARALTRALETPRDIMIQQVWAQASQKHSEQQPCNVMAISFGVQSGLWTAMANNGDDPQKAVDLAKQLGIQAELLQRMMRHIAASSYINMTAPDEYTPNSFRKSLALVVISSGYHTCPPIFNPAFLHAHDWLKDKGYTCPTDNLNTPYQAAHNTQLHWFAHLQSTPPHGQNFNNHMHGYLLGRPGWMEEGFYPDAVLLIDVGGGFGHYTKGFLSKFPDTPERLILQDLPPVLGQIQQSHPRIEKMEYDFFTKQPIKGARAYYVHFVLYDWPAEEAIKIASRVGEAMKPGYSKFLIHEHVVPPIELDYEQTALDLILMTNFGAKERSPAQWSELLEKKCGLKIVEIWTPVNGIESLIECELPE